MSARNAILERIRAGLAGRPASEPGPGPGRQALLPPAHVRAAGDLTALFLAKLTQVGATHQRIASRDLIMGALTDYLDSRGLPRSVHAPEEPLFRAIWPAAGAVERLAALEPLRPATVMSRAAGAVAETGSLAFTTGGRSRPVHNLLAEHHIIVLGAREIVPTVEDLWRQAASDAPPRALMFATGPSRTGDIEMTIELGAHGATGMHVILVDEALPPPAIAKEG